MINFRLSKTQIAAFEQCSKRLWLKVNAPREALVTPEAAHRVAEGHEVGLVARSLVADGILVGSPSDDSCALARTRELMSLDPPMPIFEAAFEFDGVIVRIDIMLPAGRNSWDIREVKSSTSTKPHHLADLATQLWVLKANGIAIASAAIRRIDGQFVYAGDGNYSGLFVDDQSDAELGAIVENRPAVVAGAYSVLEHEEPVQGVGTHCRKPHDCEFLAYCSRADISPKWPISLLPHSGAKLASMWAQQGVFDLTDLAENALADPLHQRIFRATATAQYFHDLEGAKAATSDWQYPLTFLDFETIAFAVPKWENCKPYEQVPFQYSLHVEHSDGTLKHHEFLDLSGEDPSRACGEALIRDIPTEGTVIAYNASFERRCIKWIAERNADLAEPLNRISDQIVDLLPAVRRFWYHPDQRGSWSIKRVLPTIAPELSYEGLAIDNGVGAQLAYREAIAAGTTNARRFEIDQSLRAYCRLDTIAMVAIHRHLVGRNATFSHNVTGVSDPAHRSSD